jgi:hypothetical protein
VSSERVRPSIFSNPWVLPGLALALVLTGVTRLIFGIWSPAVFVGFWCIVFEMLFWNIKNKPRKSDGDKRGR